MSGIAERDVVGFDHFNKIRPAIVLRVIDARGMAVVMYGTRTKREWAHVLVEPDSACGQRLGLTAPTYFYRQSVQPTSLVNLTRWVDCSCPADLFLRLRELAGFGSM